MLHVYLSVCLTDGQGRAGQQGQGRPGRAGARQQLQTGHSTARWQRQAMQKDLGNGFQDMVFKTWDLNFGAWEILGYGFQDMVFKTWDLNFGAWIFTLAVSKTET